MKQPKAKIGLTPEGLLIKHHLGGAWRHEDASNRFRKATKLYTVPIGVGLHTLRHTYISNAIKGGRTAKEIRDWVGHHSIIETMGTYGHLFPNYLAMIGDETNQIFHDVSGEVDQIYAPVV